ncbi:MAG: GAF domain-containing sensor histidine kinase [Chloroflexi bacterium]|nr:GAF domain-containing sensor histidine kinase [Chloroflexota bacterium]
MRPATQPGDNALGKSGLDDFGAEVAALLDAARDLASTLELPRLLEVLLDHMKRLVDYAGTSIWELQGDEFAFLGFRGPNAFNQEVARTVRFQTAAMEPHWSQLASGEPIRMRDIWDESDVAQMFRRVVGGSAMRPSLDVITSLMWVPLVIRDRVVGLLSLTSPAFDAFSQRDAGLALAIARQAAVAIENARLHERARQAAVLEERQRLARELHDSVTQGLYGISLYTAAARRAMNDGDPASVSTNLADIAETTQEAVAEMRQLLFELRPQILDEHGLAAALRSRLQAVEARAGLAAEFECSSDIRLAPDREQDLYRLAQEALSNVLKHARASRVRVALTVAFGRVVMEIEDNGVGFATETSTSGFGLAGMRERVARLGGGLQVDSAPGAGTCVRIDVPA